VERIPALPKNIAKNFMQTFFKKFGFGLTFAEGQCVLRKVHTTIPCLSPFTFVTIFFLMLMLFLICFSLVLCPHLRLLLHLLVVEVVRLRLRCLQLHHLPRPLLHMKSGQQTSLREPLRCEGVYLKKGVRECVALVISATRGIL
jgi:hypothetical protein